MTPGLRLLALLLTLFTGFTGLVYEVAWQKYLATLLGSHSEATAAVLGIFLGGLAAGYSLFGAVTRRLIAQAAQGGRAPPLLAWYGALEAGIGAYALLFPLFFLGVQALSVRIPHAAGGLGFAVDVGLAALLVAPPTVLMGGTIPFLTQALARSLDDATRIHALVYAFNTAGAFAGALAAGFVLVPALGLVRVMLAMGLVNLAAGAIFVALDRRRQVAAGEPAALAAPVRVPWFAGYAVVALLTGFAMMCVQTAAIRVGSLSFGSTEFTFSMVVAVFVLCIALGSFGVSALPRIPRSLLVANQWALAVLLIGLYQRLPDGPYLVHRLRILFTGQPEAFYFFQLGAFLGALGLLGLPVVLSGASLPLLFDHLRRQVGELGAVAGRLYSWNTVGSLLGALLGGYALLFWLDLDTVFRIAIAAVSASAVLAGLLGARVRQAVVTAIVALPVVALLWSLEPWSPRRLSPGLFRVWSALAFSSKAPEAFLKDWWNGTSLPFYDDDPTVSVLVMETSRKDVGVDRSILVNGKSDSATVGDSATTGLLALLPALFADKLERAFVIGYGTGFTVGELAALESTREVVVAEISPAVIRAAPLFDFANGNASQNPKVKFVRSDAYRALLRSEGEFDVIVSEPSNPWVAGVEMLYSVEFLAAARERLAPGGVFVQWFHQYTTSDEAIELVLRTYAGVFDHVSVWYGVGHDLLLLGFDDPDSALDLERLERRSLQSDFARGLRRSGVPSFPALLAHEILPLGVVHAMELDGPLHTLLHPRLHHLAAQAYFEGQAGDLPFSGGRRPAAVGGASSLLRRYLEAHRSDARAWTEAVLESCRRRSSQCTALLARWLELEGTTDAYQQALADAGNASGGAFGPYFNPNLIPTLASTYLSSSALPESMRPAVAQRAENLLRVYHDHAVPMQSERLLEIWERCVPAEEDAADDCVQGLAAARAMLGVEP